MKTSIKMDSAVDVDLDDTNAGHADALDGAFVMGVAERLGIAWVLRSKVGNQNLPVYTFTGPRAALREFCRIIVPNGSFDPLGDEEPAPAPPAPQAIRKIAEELATAQELAGAAWARADILGDEASRLLRRVEEVNAQTRALRAVFEKESARAAALREVLTLLTTTTTTTTSKESI